MSNFTRRLAPNTTRPSIGTLPRSPSSASRFDREVTDALQQIASHPHRWPEGLLKARRFLLRHFHYALVYRVKEAGNVQVLAIAHLSRKPGYWKGRT
ncbi:MAG TPA: type II toxin-antitoxin system RelE/ParE family toxin [Candidatus Sulfotelmatobacter sp.]|nr:type II toxin-antitoxin system RelE/ParE family toxin [Candidatus Sulfotelmatobacter sp.]